LRGDRAADVARVALAKGILDIQPDRIKLNGQVVDVGVGQVSKRRNVGDGDRSSPFFRLDVGLPALITTGDRNPLHPARPLLLAEPGSTSGGSVVVPAAADGVSRPSQYRQQHADNEEDDPQDHQKMSEGEGGEEAGEDEPENDKDDSETDHDVYLVSADMWEEDCRVSV
jgi:hypothetical protein